MRFDDIEVAICDRCGECFSWHGEVNGIRKVKIKENGYECSPDRSFVLCSSCMAKLNDWLKEEQERQAKWISTMKATQSSVTSAKQNTNSRRMSVNQTLIIAQTVVQEWRE